MPIAQLGTLSRAATRARGPCIGPSLFRPRPRNTDTCPPGAGKQGLLGSRLAHTCLFTSPGHEGRGTPSHWQRCPAREERSQDWLLQEEGSEPLTLGSKDTRRARRNWDPWGCGDPGPGCFAGRDLFPALRLPTVPRTPHSRGCCLCTHDREGGPGREVQGFPGVALTQPHGHPLSPSPGGRSARFRRGQGGAP